jgi:hypothetical protein
MYIKENRLKDDLIVSRHAGYFTYYTGLSAITLADKITDLEKFKEANKRAWFLVWLSRSDIDTNRDKNFKAWLHDNCKLVKEYRSKRYDYQINIVQIYLLI